MAYAILTSLAQTIRQNYEQYPLSVNGKQYLVSLLEQVFSLRDFIEKFPEEAKCLETRMRDAANGAEDVIEHFMYEHMKSSGGGRRTDIKYDLGELKLVMAEFDSIAREISAGITTGDAWLSNTPAKQSVPMPAPAFDSVTVGLESDLEKIKDLVCGYSLKRKVILITGMAGIGKTTLSNKVYNHPSIMGTFEVCAWVTVSQDYKLENIFADLLCSLRRAVGEGSGESNGSNEDKVTKILRKRKYLIVVDDLWNKKAWNEIGKAFPFTNNGSRIVITSRNENTAPNATSVHKMQFLDLDQSWDLLRQKVFSTGECPPELEKIGKDIATGCEGLPLAIVVVARVLSAIHESPSSWEEVVENIRSLIQEDAQFQKSMSLSYTDLPLPLRPCLLYMAGFPEDYEIRVNKLIRLWVAEGFVKQKEEAKQYLNKLIVRNLASVTTTESNGKRKGCNLHNFVRDSCRIMAIDENLERRVSYAHPDLRCVAKAYASTLRSVICFQPTESSLLGLRKLRLLRVLDVVDTHAYWLPPQVFDLFHLRYLAFSCSMEIPPAISRLRNLRTLIIRPSKRFRHHTMDEVYLPKEIWTMTLLEHLISFYFLLPDPEGAPSPLGNLHTLSVVKKLICTEEMMIMIPNVKKLEITYFGDIYKEDYQLHNLVLLENLDKLTLVLKADHPLRPTINPVLPEFLTKLTLSGWRLSWDRMGIICGYSPELEVLILRDHACEGGRWEILKDQFPRLLNLHIDSSDLEVWYNEWSQFMRLQRLEIYANESLVECVKKIQDLQTSQVRFVHRKDS